MTTILASTLDKLQVRYLPSQTPWTSMIGFADILNKDSPSQDQPLSLSNTIKEGESLDSSSECSIERREGYKANVSTSCVNPTSANASTTSLDESSRKIDHLEIPSMSTLTKNLNLNFTSPLQAPSKPPGPSFSFNQTAYLPPRPVASTLNNGLFENGSEKIQDRSNSFQLLSLSLSLKLTLSTSSPLIESGNSVSITTPTGGRSPGSWRSSIAKDTPLSSTSVDKKSNDSKPSNSRASRQPKIPKSRIHKNILVSKKFVQLSIRRKNGTSQSTNDITDISKHIVNSVMAGNQSMLSEPNVSTLGSKLHFKSLEAGMKVKLTLSDSFVSLYNHLIPGVSKRQIYKLVGQASDDGISCTYESVGSQSDSSVVSLPVQIIDSSLVNMADIPNKVLRNLANLPTFNSFNTAVNTLFGGVSDYTLIRVTRSSATTNERSVLLKLETAKPGDYSLIDDEESAEEMLHSLGKTGDSPSNIFVKKIVARPRYKSKMKIYMIPVKQDCVLYTDERMFERDLFNGIVDLTDNNPNKKDIYVTFSVNHIVQEYNSLVVVNGNFN